MIKRWMTVAIGAAVVVGLSGCVNQREYDNLYQTNRALEERNVMLQQELESERNATAMLRDRVTQADRVLTEARTRNADLNSELLRLREDFRQLNERISNIAVTPLDPATDDALRQLAQAHPNIMRYDASSGMIRLTSDLTFDLGSVEITSEAREALSQVARILNTDVARRYDARIVGHTDNVPISRPQTRQNHPTNVHLSVHRAISVRNALADAGVVRARMEVSGWGEHRPVVENPARGGAAANRRVEIYLVPSTATQSQLAGDQSEPVRHEAAADEPEPLK